LNRFTLVLNCAHIELNESIATINIYKHGDKNTHEEVQILYNEHMN